MLQSNADVVILTVSVNSVRTVAAYRIATELRNHNYTCQCIEHFSYFSVDEVTKILELCIGPDTKVLAVCSTFAPEIDGQFSSILAAMKYVKTHWPKIKIVVGGQKLESYQSEHIDVRVVGIADLVLPAYLKFLQGKNPFFQYSVDNNGQMIVKGDQANSIFDFQNSYTEYHASDFVRQNETVPLELSRGCIFKCKFCSYHLIGKKNNEYIKDMSVLKEELLRNYNDYGITRYIVMDDTHNDNLVKLRSLARMVQKLPFKLEYSAYMRLDLMRAHPENYDLLKDTGLIGTFFGIESLHWPSAKSIGKGLHPDKTIEELHRFRDRMPDVGVAAGFIVGLPYETQETLNTWVTKVIAPRFPIHSPRFTPLYATPISEGVHTSEFDREFDRWFTRTDKGWHNGNFDFAWASNYVNKLNNHMHMVKRNKMGGFAPVELYHLGMPNHREFVDKNVWHNQVMTQIADYKKRLFAKHAGVDQW